MKQKEAINKLIEEFTNLFFQGKAPSVAEFIKKYPQLAAELKPELESTLALLKAGNYLPTMPEALKQKLHNQFWHKIMAKERKRLLTVKKRLEIEPSLSLLPLKRGIEFLLLLLYGQDKERIVIRGITRIMKLLFLLTKEAECDKYCTEYYQFVPYKLGPFSIKVYEDLKLLIELGFVQRQEIDKDGVPLIYTDDAKIDEGFQFNEVTTVYTLTELGNRYAQALAKGLKPRLWDKLNQIKTRFGQMPLKELLGYVYHYYPEYTTHSEILKGLLRH